VAQQETTIVFGAVDKITPVLRGIEGQVGRLGTAFGAVAVGGIAALAAGVAKTVESLDQLGDKARALNTTTEALSALGFAAQQSGSNAETLTAGLTRLNKAIGDAAGGNAAAIDTFKRLGVTFLDASGEARSADAVFLDVADRFADLKDGAGEASIASALFGRSIGAELIPLLNEGSKGINALTREAKEFGAVIGEDAVRNAQDFKDNLDKLTVAGQSFFNGLTKELLPTLVLFSTNTADATRETGGLAESGEKLGRFINLGLAGFSALSTSVQLYANGLQKIAALTTGDFAGLEKLNKESAGLGADLTKRLDALVDGTFKLDTSMVKAGGSIKGTKEFTIGLGGAIIKLTPDVVKAAQAAEEAAKKQAALARAQAEAERTAKALAKAQDDLGESLRDAFRDGLKPATESMQALVKDVDIGVISFDNLGDSLEVLSTTSTDEAEFFADNWEGALDAVYDSLTDLIVNGLDDWEDFGKSLENIAKQFLGNLIKQFLQTNLRIPAPSVAGGPGGQGGFSFGGPGAGLGTRVGLGATGAAIAYDGYQRGSPLQGAAGGALLGFQVAGPIGAIVGAILGGVAAALNDTTRRVSVIGDDVVGTPGFRNFAPGSTFESDLGGFTFASIDNVTAQERQQLGQSVVNFDNTIASFLDDEQIDKVTDALANFNLRLEEGAISAENILGQRFDAILSTFDQDVQDFVNGATTLQERTERLAEILSRPQRLNALIDSLEEVDRLSGLNPFERALEDINTQFDAAAEEARKLGADQAQLARIEELRGNAIERLNDLQRQNLDALLDDLRFDDITEGLTPADRAVAAINQRFDRLRQQAIDLGASQEDLELIERRRNAAIREATANTEDYVEAIDEFNDSSLNIFRLQAAANQEFDALSNLRDAARGIREFLERGASVSSSNPLERFQASQAAFEDLARRASAGDLDAIRNIAGGADRFLQQAAAFYGVGSADFQRYEGLVRSTLTPLANVSDAQTLGQALAQLRTVYEALLRYLQGGNGQGVISAGTMQDIAASLARMSRDTARAY
jgi:hypothetical protein